MIDRQRVARPLWAIYEYFSMVMGLGFLAFLCLGWSPFALVFNLVLPRAMGRRWGRYMFTDGAQTYLRFLTFFCGFRFDLSELDSLRNEGPLILAANHPSLLDAVMIVSRVPNAVCVMKASLYNNIFFGAAVRIAGYIRNSAPLEMILGACDELEGDAHLIIFPEGTRTEVFPVNTCTQSTALIAMRAKVPVQTLLIEFTEPYLGKAWPLFRPPPLPLHCKIRLGKRFDPPNDIRIFTTELESYFRENLPSVFPYTPDTTAQPCLKHQAPTSF